MDEERVPLALALTACVLLVGSAMVMTLHSLSLAADGSYYLVRVLSGEAVFGPEARFLANAARQAPVLASARLGLRDTHLLTFAQGAGQLLLPALVWSTAILLSRVDRLVFAAVTLTAGVCAVSTWHFSVSESVLAIPLTVVVAVLLWLPHAWRPRHLALAVAASGVLVASYETAVLSGALLGVWSGWRAAGGCSRLERWGLALVSVAAFSSVIVGTGGLRDPDVPPSGQAFLYVLVSLEPWPLYVGLAGIGLIVGGSFLPAPTPRHVSLGAGAFLVLTSALVYKGTATAAYEARAGATLASVLLLVFLWWQWRTTIAVVDEPERHGSSFVPLAAVALVAVLVVHALRASADWERSLKEFRATITRTEGVAFADEAMPHNRQGVLFDWTSSSLSLIARSRPTDGILIDRDPSLVPFEPREARAQLPGDFVWP